MAYTVLARKFRSRSFDEVIGQGPIVTTLKNALAQDRVHHGYLFCGTRGVGKTSMARILAKCLNCLAADAPTATPCHECNACLAIARGEDVDVIEIDAASNTGVDHIRDLRNNAVYRPTRCRFKIYIIDEVHMLSPGAFNALLKTLEEPPDHVKFILATTESHKIPATIISRVQRFDFRSIPAGEIAGQLAMICRAESVEAEEAALKRLARLANGSMRDALSLLDQITSMGGKKVASEVVDELIPATHDELFADLIDRCADGDAAGALTVADASLGRGQAPDVWCTLLIAQIRDLMIMRVCGPDTELVDAPAGLRGRLAEQCLKFDGGAFVYMITVLEELRRSVKASGAGRALIDAAVIRLAEASNFSSIESLMSQLGAPSSPHVPVTNTAAAPRAPEPATKAAPARKSTTAPSAMTATPPPRRATQADLRAARAEPLVQAALTAFGGQIVDVQQNVTHDNGATSQAPTNQPS
jgi:DNA polymerase-3 subunit gamma/tau